MKITIEEAAKITGLTRNAIAYWISSGKLQATREHRTRGQGPAFVWMVDRAEVERVESEMKKGK